MTLSFILSVFPIILLIYLMVKRNALPSYVALPWIATLVMGVHLLHFNTDIVTISANVTAAIVAVQTPITVIFGFFIFFPVLQFFHFFPNPFFFSAGLFGE